MDIGQSTLPAFLLALFPASHLPGLLGQSLLPTQDMGSWISSIGILRDRVWEMGHLPGHGDGLISNQEVLGVSEKG